MGTGRDAHGGFHRTLAGVPVFVLLILGTAGTPRLPQAPDSRSPVAARTGDLELHTVRNPDYVRLDNQLSELRDAFNDTDGRIRLVLGLSPTCGACLRRARATQEHLLDRFETDELVAHVVWLPTHGARERHVGRVLDLVPDERATHYWDAEGAFMRMFEEPLSSGSGDAEGVVMLYERNVRWADQIPPVPAAWVYEPRHIDRLGRHLASLLGE